MFCSKTANGRSNNPAYPSDVGVPTWQDGQNGQDGQLTYVGGRPEVKRAAAIFEFFETNTMTVKYTVSGCCINKGRNFMFSGAVAPLMPCESPPPSAQTPRPPPIPPSPPSPPVPPPPPPPPGSPPPPPSPPPPSPPASPPPPTTPPPSPPE